MTPTVATERTERKGGVRAAAELLRSRGLAICKPDRREKKLTYEGWSAASLEASDFEGADMIGIVLGPLSGGVEPGHALVAIDLDSAVAVARAGEFLPQTDMVEGRAGKPRSHRYFLVPVDTIPDWATSTAEQASAAALNETGHAGPFTKSLRHRDTREEVLRFVGTGGQVVAPPSLHPSGEQREWEGGEPGSPAAIPFPELWEAACRLAETCGARPPSGVGWPWDPPRQRSPNSAAVASPPTPGPPPHDEVVAHARAYVDRLPPAVSGQGGHNRTFAAACALTWGFDLDADTAFSILQDRFNPRCQPRWSDTELRHKVDDAAKVSTHTKPRGYLRDAPPVVGQYFVRDGAIHRVVQSRDGAVEVPLCNFSARITGQTTRDDGAERTTFFTLAGETAAGTALPPVDVPADQFSGLNWVTGRWGNRPVVYAGQGNRDHLRVAIQMLSDDVPERTVYAHTGWREVGGQWCYLHGGGAIVPVVPTIPGSDAIHVGLDGVAAEFRLPAPPGGSDLGNAVRASLGLFSGLVPDTIAFPLLATTYRAALGGADYSLWLSGPTGAQKSELAALGQQHFGATMARNRLPGNWSSTENALEGLAFTVKDALLIVDDFAPPLNRSDADRQHRAAERLIRAQGNHSGRQRMRADGTLRPPKPPRGLILATGEDVPRGHSIAARLAVVEVQRGAVNLARLSECQRDAGRGAYAAAMAGFTAWLAPQYPDVRRGLEAERTALRDQFVGQFSHARTPDIIANLLLGLRYLLRFGEGVGAISPGERESLWARGEAAFQHLAVGQGEHQRAADPVARFPEMLLAILSSGRGHLADADGGMPASPELWGWVHRAAPGDAAVGASYSGRGRKIGWVGPREVFLEPDSTFAALSELAHDQAQAFPLTKQTLQRRLNEAGILVRTERDRTTYPVRVEGTRRPVLVVSQAALLGETGTTGTVGTARGNPSE